MLTMCYGKYIDQSPTLFVLQEFWWRAGGTTSAVLRLLAAPAAQSGQRGRARRNSECLYVYWD